MNLPKLARYLATIISNLPNVPFSITTKANTNLGLEGENIKNILSTHKGGYILIKWNE